MHDLPESPFVSDRCRYFFDRGLRFRCRQCGRCCTGDPGTVNVPPDEITAIAAYLGIGKGPLFSRDEILAFLDGTACPGDR